MAVMIFVPGAMPSFSLDGQPVAATLSFYEADTAQPTPATVYSDPALTVPHPWPLPSDSSGQFPAVWGPDDVELTVGWETDDGQSDTWTGVTGVTSADAAILAAANYAKTLAEAAQAGAEAAEASAQAILDQIIAQGGDDGWTPVLSLTTDGARIVVAITWTGGDGTPPTSGYLGSTGVVTDIASAVNIRGPSGPGSGDVLQSGAVTAGHLAVFAADKTIEDGGEYDWSTVPNKPTFGNAILLNLASQAEAETGTSNTTLMTPLRVAQVLANTSTQILPSSTKTANYQALLNDRGSLLVLNGTFTLSFNNAATLGANWFVYTYSTGDVTFDPAGAETIDGLTSFISYPGEMRLIRCTGTALVSYVLKGFSKTFSASGSFTKPPGYLDFEGEIWGAGGGGASSGSNGPGGGGGACVPFKVAAATLGITEVVTIGAGGASVTGLPGLPGGNSSLGSIVVAYGGAGAIPGGVLGGGGGGGAFSAASTTSLAGGNPRVVGSDNPGFGGGDSTASGDAFSSVYGGGGGAYAAAAGNSVYGGGGGGSGSANGFGGSSRFGGSGGRGRSNANADPGTAPGGGGGGTSDVSKASGAGARGEVRIRGVT